MDSVKPHNNIPKYADPRCAKQIKCTVHIHLFVINICKAFIQGDCHCLTLHNTSV